MPKANDNDHKFKKDIKKGMTSMMKANRLLMKQVSDLHQEVAKLQDIIHNNCSEEPMLSIPLSKKLDKFAYNVGVYVGGLYKVYNNEGWNKSLKEGRKLAATKFILRRAWGRAVDSGMMTAPSSANHALGNGIKNERSTATATATNDD
ncbi:hypothetical protein BDA99DRAFT_544621 [Phascolomyces articulosus]|uniref:Uncharacterized protein n=1 Tax=Phascolomyces articulosus TaxID=60185 RepID=A0AAD5P6Q9_9FUNG|nr:hypothetical protein BDA99DRAFT_544621 [Phascolomyces articulosus]